MTKKIMLIALSALFIGGTAFAAEPATCTTQCPAGKECRKDKKECEKNRKSCDAKQNCNDGKKCDRPNPFEGITLTAEQKTKLEALKQECKTRENKVKEGVKAEGRKAGERSREWLGKVKEVLTPEQYVTFLENSFVSKDGRHGKHPRMAQLKGHGKQTKGKARGNGDAKTCNGGSCSASAPTASK